MNSTLAIILLLADVVFFTIYNAYVLTKFGVPVNLSITYYHLDRVHKGWGITFPLLVVFVCCTALPVWILTSINGSTWGVYFLPLPCITLVCLLAVAFSGRYKKRPKLIYFHYGCAIIAATCAVVWLCLVAYQSVFLYLRLGIIFALVFAGIQTGTFKRCTLFWLENAAFYCIFLTLLLVYLIPMPV